MSKQVLRMKYHPAKKEVKFQRFQNGKEINIEKTSKLKIYENKKGSFVLQDHGKNFFDRITAAFDSEPVVNIEVITTKNDYEDFEQMVEYYNENKPPVTINATFLCELPDMDKIYRTVREYGENSISTLNVHRAGFCDVLSVNSPQAVKDCVNNFSEKLQKEIDSIKEKTAELSKNEVNLCFTGVFSSGKSALINAIIGYDILPENIKSETARMFRITSPKAGESVRLNFCYRKDYFSITWDDKKKVFEFTAGTVENEFRAEIQKTINENAKELQHTQLCKILEILNKKGDSNITNSSIFFPIPLDNEKVQFTIYDTPGTDSNYNEHQMVLKDALSDQTHSILIFVIAPDRTEGEGNISLLNFLKEAENNNSKTSIDLARSLFVINKADGTNKKERKDLCEVDIKNKKIAADNDSDNDSENDEKYQDSENDFSINLSNKKLFFTSAMYSYAAAAIKNNVATQDHKNIVEDDYNKVLREDRGLYFMQNRCAASELAAKRQHEKTKKALDDAIARKNVPEIFHICSGVYTLENEIVEYGEKYASAVKAYAIIDTVDKTLSNLLASADSLIGENIKDINEVNNVIQALKDAIAQSIETAHKKNELPSDRMIPEEIAIALHLDGAWLNENFIGKIKIFIDKLLKGWLWGLGKVKYKKTDKEKIEDRIVEALNDYTFLFLEKRQKLLIKRRDMFIAEVKEIIRNNGDISEDAKKFILNIRPPEVKAPSSVSDFGALYDARKRTQKILWFEKASINKKEFLDDVDDKLAELVTELQKNYYKDFYDSLKVLLEAIKTEFVTNLEQYSVLLKAKMADKKATEDLGKKIIATAKELENRQQNLEKLIWGMNENE